MHNRGLATLQAACIWRNPQHVRNIGAILLPPLIPVDIGPVIPWQVKHVTVAFVKTPWRIRVYHVCVTFKPVRLSGFWAGGGKGYFRESWMALFCTCSISSFFLLNHDLVGSLETWFSTIIFCEMRNVNSLWTNILMISSIIADSHHYIIKQYFVTGTTQSLIRLDCSF